MMVKVSATIVIFYVTSSWPAIENRPLGWLDRIVPHYKKVFLGEVPFQATIEKKPSGYVDSTAWDFDSVMRLLALIQSSDNEPLQRTIQKALKPTRRLFFTPGKNKFRLFPSLAKEHIDNFYYDGVDSAEYWASEEVNVVNESDTSAIIQVTNPVEAHLPSARISVDLLKDIMMARALAARAMPAPTTTKPSTKRRTTTRAVCGGPILKNPKNPAAGTTIPAVCTKAPSAGSSKKAAFTTVTAAFTLETAAEATETAAFISETAAAATETASTLHPVWDWFKTIIPKK